MSDHPPYPVTYELHQVMTTSDGHDLLLHDEYSTLAEARRQVTRHFKGLKWAILMKQCVSTNVPEYK